MPFVGYIIDQQLFKWKTWFHVNECMYVWGTVVWHERTQNVNDYLYRMSLLSFGAYLLLLHTVVNKILATKLMALKWSAQ